MPASMSLCRDSGECICKLAHRSPLGPDDLINAPFSFMTDSVHGYGRHARVRKTSASALHEQDGERMKQGRRAAQGRGGYPSPCCRAFVRQPHERRCRAFR